MPNLSLVVIMAAVHNIISDLCVTFSSCNYHYISCRDHCFIPDPYYYFLVKNYLYLSMVATRQCGQLNEENA